MPAYNDVSISIRVDGVALPEYGTQYDHATKEVSCWIPSHSGKEFDIEIHNTTQHTFMKAVCRMDGVIGTGRRVRPGEQGVIDKYHPSLTTCRSLLFSPVKLVDDDELPIEASNIAGLGTIEVTMHEGTLIKRRHRAKFEELEIPKNRLIPERGKKGILECVGKFVTPSLGPVQDDSTRRLSRSATRITALRAKFIFRYRSLAFLQAQGVASSDVDQAQTRKRAVDDAQRHDRPAKVPKISNGDEEILKIEEISDEEDTEKLLALRSRIDKALARRDMLSPARVKKEAKGDRGSRPPTAEVIEIIDLT